MTETSQTRVEDYDLTPTVKTGVLHNSRLVLAFGPTPATRVATLLALLIIFLGLWAAAVAQSLTAFFVAVALTAVTLLLRSAPWPNGRTIGLQEPVLADAVWVNARALILKRKGADAFQNEGPQGGTNTLTGEPFAAEAPAAVGHCVWLSHTIEREDRAAEIGIVIHDSTDRTTGFLEVLPPPRGHADPDDLDQIAQGLTNIARTFGNSGFGSILASITTVEPQGDSPRRDWDQRPPAPGTPTVLNASHEQLMGEVDKTPRYRTFAGIVLEGSRELRQAVKLKGGGDTGLGRIVAEELETLAMSYRDGGYKVLGPLGSAGLMTLARNAYDHDVRILPPGHFPPMAPNYAWPISIETHPRNVLADGWHTSVWHVDLPLMARRAGFDRRFVTENSDIRRRHVMLRRLTPTGEALVLTEDMTNTNAAVQEAVESRGGVYGRRAAMGTEAAQHRTDRLASGDVGVSVIQYVAITARDLDTLHDHERRMRNLAAESHMTMTVQYKDQARAMAAVLPLGLGIR